MSYEKVKCSKHSGEEMAVCCVRVLGHIAQGGVDEGGLQAWQRVERV